MFKGRNRFRGDEKWDIFQIIPRVKILKQVQDDEIPGQARDDGMPDQVRHDDVQDDGGMPDQVRHDGEDIVGKYSIDLEERLKCNMGRAKEDACMLEKIINNKP